MQGSYSMACPKCGGYMFAFKDQGVDIDYCQSCRGVWLDQGELAAIVPTVGDVPACDVHSSRSSYTCPRCGNALHEGTCGIDIPVLIDMCSSCRGVFLDNGELPKIKRAGVSLQVSLSPAREEKILEKTKRRKALSAIYGTENPAAKATVTDRMVFIRNVYMLLTVTLVVTAIGAIYGIQSGLGIKLFEPALYSWIPVFILTLYARRIRVINLILLFVFTFQGGFCLAAALDLLISSGRSAIIWQAALLTAANFGGLSIYVHVTKKDFSWMEGMLYIGLLCLIISGIYISLFSTTPFTRFAESIFGALVFSGYVLFDTSMIIHKYDTTEVIFATIDLYVDIFMLFVDFLRILSYLEKK